MVELQPMFSGEARIKGYKVLESLGDNELGYEVTYLDGYKSWTPKDIADAAYYKLSKDNDGTKVLKEDVENFITDVEVITIGEKTTVVNAHTLTGFDTVRHSSCVDPKTINNFFHSVLFSKFFNGLSMVLMPNLKKINILLMFNV